MFYHIVGLPGKQPKTTKKDANRADLVEIIHTLDVEAEERFQEREEKRLKMFLDAEEKRRKDLFEEEKEMKKLEREHDERMQRMFMGCMQQMMTACFGQQYSQARDNCSYYQQHGQFSQSSTPQSSTPRSYCSPFSPNFHGQDDD